MSASTDPADYVWIRSNVEWPGGIDTAYQAVPRAEWDAMTERERESFCVEIAIEHQNNTTPCGASPVDLAEVPDVDRDHEMGVR